MNFDLPFSFDPELTYAGFKVILESSMCDKVWTFPKDKYIEYGPEDEWWARRLGFGYEKTVPWEKCYVVGGDTILMHPLIWDRLNPKKPEFKVSHYHKFDMGPILPQPGFLIRNLT